MQPTLDIDLLRTFQAVARLGQFRAAAEHVHRSPAAVSVQIQRLEAIIGARLLDRDNQSVSLTATGQRVLIRADDLLSRHDAILGELRGKRQAGRIKFGVPDEYAAHVIRDILPRFASQWPEVVLELVTAPSLTLADKVARGHLHLGITVRPIAHAPAADALAVTTPVWVEGEARGRNMPALAGQTDTSTPPQAPLPLALHANGCCYRDAMMTALDDAGLPWRVVLTSPSSLAVETCVETGLAVSLIDRSRVTPRMHVRNDLPVIAQHEVLLSRAAKAGAAVDLLEAAIRRYFRL